MLLIFRRNASQIPLRHHTKETLEDSARAVYDARKNARRPPYVQMRAMSLDEERPLPPKKDWRRPPPRLRSGSGTTTTSESADEMTQVPSNQSNASSATSAQPSGLSPNGSSFITPPPRSQSHGVMHGHTEASRLSPPSQSSSNTSLGVTPNTHAALSPIASRVLASDAGAMAEYMKRNRSGSHGESSRHLIVQASSLHSSNTTPPIMEEPIAQKYSLRRLRPSLSAAALRQTPPVSVVSPAQAGSGPGADIRSRFRAGTNPSPSLRPQFSSPVPASARPSEESPERVPAARTATNGTLPSLYEPRDISPARQLPTTDPPALPPKDDYQGHRRGPSVS